MPLSDRGDLMRRSSAFAVTARAAAARAVAARSVAVLVVAALAVAMVVIAWCSAARVDARERLTGVVLMAPSATTVVVHHEPFGGMPAMTMTFAVAAGTSVHPGDRIAADADTSRDPWRLSSVRVIAAATVPHFTLPHFLEVGDRIPDIPLVDEHGAHETLAALRGHPYALTFIYTRCRDPKMCPLVSAKLHALQARTAGTNSALVEVSLDPAYDRPPILARYGTIFGADFARWHLFTGDPRTVLDFAARFRILERSAGPDTIVHTERLAIVSPAGRITRFFDDPTWRPTDIANALTAAN